MRIVERVLNSIASRTTKYIISPPDTTMDEEINILSRKVEKYEN